MNKLKVIAATHSEQWILKLVKRQGHILKLSNPGFILSTAGIPSAEKNFENSSFVRRKEMIK